MAAKVKVMFPEKKPIDEGRVRLLENMRRLDDKRVLKVIQAYNAKFQKLK